jgi:hypothetical protein
VFQNKVLRRIFGPKRDEITEEWRKLHNEELNGLHCPSNTTQVIKSRRMRWAGQVARMGKRRGVYRVSVGEPEGKMPIGRTRVDGKMILKLKLVSKKCDADEWTGLIWLRTGSWRC